MSSFDPLVLARALIACPSVTPDDAGAQDVLASALANLGFTVTRLRFGGTKNLFARIGSAGPHACFAGHTDVVPPGPGWRHDPFGAVIEGGVLYGRGACDMKGAIAAFVAAAARHLEAGPPRGSISLLITGDEEGPATDGTVRVLDWMAANGQLPDCCIVGEPTNQAAVGDMIKIGRRGSLNATITCRVGEPTNQAAVGDMIKIGRRGSLNATITCRGVQGHVAYPHRAHNPIPSLVAALADLSATRLDEGTQEFEPSSLQITSIDVGNPASNVIPAAAEARLNIRFNDRHTGASLSDWLRARVARHAPDAEIVIATSGEAFLAPPELGRRLAASVARVSGRVPALDTGGGTSDARFIARYAPVAEFGLVGATMHQADECVPVVDLQLLTDIYAAMLQDLLP